MMGARNPALEQAHEAVERLRHTRYDTGTEKGCQPRTALEWLAWRDGQIFMLEQFKEAIGRVVLTRHYGPNPQPDWWRSAMVESAALCFRRAEFMVWEEPQWQEVLAAAPAFEGSRIHVASHCWLLATWRV